MKNQIKHSIRSFKRSPLLLFVSIPGLMVGITAAVLLLAYIKHEINYDRSFPNKARIVRLYNRWTEDRKTETYPICLRKAYTEVPGQIPEIELAAQIYNVGRSTVSFKQKKLKGQDVMYADKEFFDLFGLHLIEGNEHEALKDKNTAVLTRSFANKTFGNLNCIGKPLTVGDASYTITGIVNDLPETTHFHFDVLLSFSTLDMEYFSGLEFYTYYLLKPNTNFEEANQKISSLYTNILTQHFGEIGVSFQSGIEKLLRLHLHSITDFDLSEKGNLSNIYMLAAIVFFILLIVVVNYINLFVLYGEKRASEIGVRKSFGASIRNLIKMFYFESTVLNMIAFLLTFLIISTLLSSSVISQLVDISFLKLGSPSNIAIILSVLLIMVLITGAYPAFYLSRLKAIDVMKSGIQSVKRKKRLSIISVVIQFAISTFLLTAILIIHSQLNYLKRTPLGFDAGNVYEVYDFKNNVSVNEQSVKEELSKLTFITRIGSAAHFMGGGCSGEGIYRYGESEKEGKSINEYRIREGFGKTLGLQLAEGRFYNGTSNDKKSIILNKAAVKMLGLKNPVGKQMVLFDAPLEIVGVVKDFYYNQYAGEEIAPLVLSYANEVNVFYLKIPAGFDKEKQKAVEKVFRQFEPDYKLNYLATTAVFNSKFFEIDRLLKLLGIATLIAVILSFMGMFALSVFNVEKRTKEIGVRKVLGSGSAEVVFLLIKDTLKWVLIAMPLPFLLVYIMMNQWLNGFANRVSITPWYFIVSALAVLAIATLAVSIKAMWAARRNPVESLRYE